MFSVVMPLWNKRDLLPSTTASVLDQSWRDFELVVVDDGSTDGGTDVLASFGDPRIRTIVQANAGPGAARNAGIEAARHDWLAFVDADDLWLPGHLAELDRIRRAHPEAGLIGTSYAVPQWDRDSSLRGTSPPRIGPVDYFREAGAGRRLLCASSAAIPRRTYAELGPFLRVRAGDDSEYWARIALDRQVAVSPRVTVVYRHGSEGISATNAAKKLGEDVADGRELGPVFKLLIERYPVRIRPELRGGVEDYLEFRFGLCVRNAARIGDFRMLRALRRLYLRSPPILERLILATARLPQPLARGVYGLGFKAKALIRALRRASHFFKASGSPTPLDRAPERHVD